MTVNPGGCRDVCHLWNTYTTFELSEKYKDQFSNLSPALFAKHFLLDHAQYGQYHRVTLFSELQS